MKKPLIYTLVAEGFAEYTFVPIYLKRLAAEWGLQIKRSPLDLLKKQPSKSKVLAEAEELCLKALRDEEQTFYVIGVDLDVPDQTDEQGIHTAECAKILKALGSAQKAFGDQIYMYVPVQAIEHWLMYQAYHTKLANKPSTGSVEKEPQEKLKKILYGGRNDRRQMQTVAQKIAESANFDELAKQSRSFAHLHNQVTDFLKHYKTSST